MVTFRLTVKSNAVRRGQARLKIISKLKPTDKTPLFVSNKTNFFQLASSAGKNKRSVSFTRAFITKKVAVFTATIILHFYCARRAGVTFCCRTKSKNLSCFALKNLYTYVKYQKCGVIPQFC